MIADMNMVEAQYPGDVIVRLCGAGLAPMRSICAVVYGLRTNRVEKSWNADIWNADVI